MDPDSVVEQGKPLRLPAMLSNAILINEYPFSIGVEVSHNKWLEPTITLIPIKEVAKQSKSDLEGEIRR